MRILVYGLNYAPELIGIGKYTQEACEWLASRGHDVCVITSYPYYPDWRVAPPYSGGRFSREERRGVKIIRCPLYVPSHPSPLKRILHHLTFAASSAPAAIWLAFRFRPDILFTVAPSQSVTPAALLAAGLSGARSWLHIQDFEIDSSFELGILSGQRLRRLAERMERFVLRRFKRVSTISPKMAERLAEKRVDPLRIVEFRNWVDTSVIRPQDRCGPLRDQLGLPAQAITALYSGSMAFKQGLETLIEAARILRDQNPNLVLVLCGQGARRGWLMEQARGQSNVRFLDLQPQERLAELLSLADVHLLPQRAEVADLVLPSKLAPMLASGRPVVAMAQPGTQLAIEVEGAGLVVPPGDPEALASALIRLAGDPDLRGELGQVARKRAETRWDAQAILGRIESELSSLARSPTPAASVPRRT
jgi:colanic acid biosynthesis glycosyl transferase WcaI